MKDEVNFYTAYKHLIQIWTRKTVMNIHVIKTENGMCKSINRMTKIVNLFIVYKVQVSCW